MVHRDLALRNLLVDGEGVVRISDFGLTASASKSAENTNVPLAWTAPEGKPIVIQIH